MGRVPNTTALMAGILRRNYAVSRTRDLDK